MLHVGLYQNSALMYSC